MRNKKGLLIVVSGPSGAGKGTVCQALLEKRKDIALSVSATTRAPRPGEVDGVNYYFLSEDAFRSMIQEEEFIEWACFCGNYYGTPKKMVEEQLDAGNHVILEIEVQGAMQVKSEFPEGAYVFILPPSIEELENRLVGRGTEEKQVVETRLKRAVEECSYVDRYNYIVVNDTVEKAVAQLEAVIEAETLRMERNTSFIKDFLNK